MCVLLFQIFEALKSAHQSVCSLLPLNLSFFLNLSVMHPGNDKHSEPVGEKD